MKQFLRSLWTLLLLMMWCSVGFAQTTVTFVAGTDKSDSKTLTKDGVTLKIGDGKLNNGTDFRCYANKGFTISSNNADITKIEFTCAGKGTEKFGPGKINNPSTGKYAINGYIGTWTGLTKSVKFSNSAQVQMKKIVVTLASSKTPTNLTFPKPTINIEEGDEATFTGQKATLKAGETELDKAITYAYSGSEIFATFNTATGEATLKTGVYGTATVTATYAGDDTYEEAVASYTVKIVDPNAIVPLVFDKADDAFGTLENYNKDKKDISEYALIGSDGNSYTFKTTGGKTAAENGNLLLQKTTGSLESPIFKNFENGYTVNITFSQGGTKPLTITSGGETKKADITSDVGDNTNGIGFLLSMNIKAGNTFTLKAGNAAYISKIEIVAIPGITLDENAADTDTKIEKNNGKTQDVALTRTLVADKRNTFCVPFETEIAGTALEGATIKAIGTVVGNVINLEDATKIEAGMPYLVMPNTDDIVNPTFKSVTISVTTPVVKGNDVYKFVGTYSPKTIEETEFGTIWGVTAEGKLAKINANTTMKGLRAYFVFPTTTAAAKLNFDGETTGINNIETNAAVNGKVYNLNGQYVGNSLNGLKKGIYVVNGKKVIK